MKNPVFHVLLMLKLLGGGGTVEALESMLMEISRVRLHGFSEREISVVRALTISEMESAFLERYQMQSTSLR